MTAKGRKLQLLIDGSPVNFALQNISEGGAMGEGAPKLEPGAAVYVRFEGGILVPAIVKWTEDGMVGLAFTAPIMLDRSWMLTTSSRMRSSARSGGCLTSCGTVPARYWPICGV